ncbi:DUF3800 domain-containing protein [Hirschia litorea]|uniref:DUF3800 domain-containing protein n=1 Tax=Hirschia litorea TaxID=1199156 RepID=A0ABW2INE0_9PROT
MNHYYAYIDEAGDEGFGKLRNLETRGGQSTWLMLGAIIVSSDTDKLLPSKRDELRSKFPTKKNSSLHWSNLKHEQRIVAVNMLSDIPMGVAVMMSHKVTIPGGKFEHQFKKPQWLYNYLVRFLIERLISACERKSKGEPCVLHLTFSQRGGTNYQTMSEYFKGRAADADVVKTPRRTDWSILDIEGIRVENHTKRAGLQIADCTTSAFFTALEPNRYGNIEPAYATKLIPNLITKNKSSYGEGLTIVPNLGAANPSEEQLHFLRECWKNR